MTRPRVNCLPDTNLWDDGGFFRFALAQGDEGPCLLANEGLRIGLLELTTLGLALLRKRERVCKVLMQ